MRRKHVYSYKIDRRPTEIGGWILRTFYDGELVNKFEFPAHAKYCGQYPGFTPNDVAYVDALNEATAWMETPDNLAEMLRRNEG